jgi:hypothetical protein
LAPALAAAKPASAQVSPAEGTITDLRERNRVENRAATVHAAFVLVAERGYCHVTVADICEALGSAAVPSSGTSLPKTTF